MKASQTEKEIITSATTSHGLDDGRVCAALNAIIIPSTGSIFGIQNAGSRTPVGQREAAAVPTGLR